MIALLLLGCGEADPVAALLACTDDACHTRTIEAAYAADAAQVTEWMSALPDPVVQAALLDQLTHADPAAAKTLCQTVPRDRETRTRCSRRNVRPHLFANPGGQKTVPKRNPNAAPGPRSSNLPVPPSAASMWADTTLPPLECGDRQASRCAVDAAITAAAEGEGAAVIGAQCREGYPEDERGYGECLFKAAEVVAQRGADGVPDALSLCSDSVFGPMCVAHMLTFASPPVPTADAFTDDDIAAAQRVAEALSEAPDGVLYVDSFWAIWVHSSFAGATVVHGSLLDHLPQEALHHVPIAAALRLMTQDAPRSFPAALDQLVAALADRPAPHRQRTRPAATWLKAQHWERDWSGEERFPTTWMLGPARRVRAETPDIDRQISVLEAAGQLVRPPPADFFLSVLDDPTTDRRVRWTAARIGASLDAAAAAKREDADALIQARLSGSRTKGKKAKQ